MKIYALFHFDAVKPRFIGTYRTLAAAKSAATMKLPYGAKKTTEWLKFSDNWRRGRFRVVEAEAVEPVE